MGFIRINKEDLRYGIYDNLVGLPLTRTSEEILKSNLFKTEKKESIKTSTLFQKEVLLPVLMEKVEQFEFDKQGTIKDQKVVGRINVHNPGKGDKIWDINLSLREPTENEFEKQYIIQELNAQEDWKKEFVFNSESESPLRLMENISNISYPSDEKARVPPILVKDVQNFLYFKIWIENVSSSDIFNLEVFKRLPESVEKVLETKVEFGSVLVDKTLLTWRIDHLPKGKRTSLLCKIAVMTKPTGSGTIQVRYLIKEQFSDFKVTKLTGFARMGDEISINEQDQHPGVWDCGVKFFNRSEFTVQINKYDIKALEISKDSYINIDKTIRLNPTETFEFPKWQIESRNRPAFQKQLDYTILYEQNFIRTGLLQLDEMEVNVFEIEAKKELSNKIWPSFKEGFADCKVIIKNLSTVSLNHFLVIDTIPRHFLPPQLQEIRILLNGEEFQWSNLNGNTKEKQLEIQSLNLSKRLKQISDSIEQIQSERIQSEKDSQAKNIQSIQDEISRTSKVIENTLTELNNILTQKNNTQKNSDERNGVLEQIQKEILSITKDLEDKKNILNVKNLLIKEDGLKKELLNKLASAKETASLKEKGLKDTLQRIQDLNNKIQDIKKKEELLQKSLAQQQESFNNVKMQLKTDKDNAVLQTKHNSLKAEISSLKKNLDQIGKDTKTAVIDLKKATDQKSAYDEDIRTNNQLKADLEQNIEEKNGAIQALQRSAKLSQDPDLLSKQIKEQETRLSQANEKRKLLLNELEKMRNTLTEFDKSITSIKSKQQNSEKSLTTLKESLTIRMNLIKESEMKNQNLDSLNKEYSAVQDQLEKIQEDLKRVSIDKTDIDKIETKFDTLCFDPQFSAVDVEITPANNDYSIEHELHIVLLNLDKLMESLKVGGTLEIQYPLKTIGLNPSMKSMYVFPTILKCNSLIASVPYKFNIGQENLPNIEIEHKRHRISLCRFVDHYQESGKFDISLLIKNEASEALTDLEIYDTIPKSANIANTEFEFSLKENSRPDLTTVVWRLKDLAGYQEVELRYLLSVEGNGSFNLNDMNVSIN